MILCSFLFVFNISLNIFTIFSTVDFKKVSAYVSIFHMNLTFSFLIFSTNIDFFFFELSWSHHSLVASANFFWIGLFYAFLANRITRFLGYGFSFNVLLFFSLFLIFFYILDFPWSSSTFTELFILSKCQNQSFFFFFDFLSIIFFFFSTNLKNFG